MPENKVVKWQDITKKEVKSEIWENFSEKDRNAFFEESEKEETDDSKANIVAQNTWLGR